MSVQSPDTLEVLATHGTADVLLTLDLVLDKSLPVLTVYITFGTEVMLWRISLMAEKICLVFESAVTTLHACELAEFIVRPHYVTFGILLVLESAPAAQEAALERVGVI